MAIYSMILFLIIISGIYLFEIRPTRLKNGIRNNGKDKLIKHKVIKWCYHMGEKQMVFFYLALMGILLAVVGAMRYAIGFDYYSYRSIYEYVAQLNPVQILSQYPREFLFYECCKLLSWMGISYTGFLFLYHFWFQFVYFRFIYHYSRTPWMSVYFFVVFQFLAHSMNLIRQSIVAAFFILAYPYFIKKKFLPYAAILMIGGFFHNSLFFLIPFYFLLHWKNTKKSMAVILCLAMGIFLFADSIILFLSTTLLKRYAGYLGGFYWQGNSVAYVILPAMYFLLCLYFRPALRKSNPNVFSVYCNSALYTFLINLFIMRHFILERFSIFPFSLSLLVIPEILYHYRRPKEGAVEDCPEVLTRRGAILMVFFLGFGAAWFCFAAKEGYHKVYPYIGLWDRAISNGPL